MRMRIGPCSKRALERRDVRREIGEMPVTRPFGGAGRDQPAHGDLRALRVVERDDEHAGRRDPFEHGALDVRGVAAEVVEIEHRAVRAAEEHHAVGVKRGANVFDIVGGDVGRVEIEVRLLRGCIAARAQRRIRPELRKRGCRGSLREQIAFQRR
jgi:hypothetical protein